MSERVVVIRTPDGELPACFMPKTVDLVGEGCPWATVDQMADDLFLLSKVIGPSDPHATVTAMRRGHEAAALLSSGSNP